jgi:hypothetical protein
VRINSKTPITPGLAREFGLSFTLLMLLAYHFFDGGLQNRHVYISVLAGLGFWAIWRYAVVSRRPGE